MAELNVEPKKRTSIWPWLLLGLAIVALIFFLSRRGDDTDTTAGTADTSGIGAVGADSRPSGQGAAPAASDWGSIDRNAPALSYPEIGNKDINVRGTDSYAVYDLGEDVLFDKQKSEIRQDAVANLEQVAASIKQRFDQGPIRLYGFTDAQGDEQFNQQLAQARAEAVKKWLVTKGTIDESRITIQAVGEADPKASNSTEQGRQQNRRVQIAARKASGV